MQSVPAAEPLPPLLINVLIGIAIVLAMVLLWIARKGRRIAGDHVFQASRWSRGNHIFPAQVVITPDSLTLYKPQWIGKLEESIHLAHVSSIKIDTNLMFADIYVETSGGQNPVVCHGHTKGDAVEIKQILEKFQSMHYRTQNLNGARERDAPTGP